MRDIRTLWELTAYETEEIIAAGRSAERSREDRRRSENELLAFNIGALVFTAVNAPGSFPDDPYRAFGWACEHSRPDGGKADLIAIAEQLNMRLPANERDNDK